jgi:demethylmenaquinone methyltransferase/2-methoxy-6-polyprenyl-1,4-benzoquinol methylase
LGDALHLPIADGAFDFATMAFGLRNLADPVAGLREVARVLRPGGQAAILEFSMPRNRLVAPLYRFYLGRVLPRVGRVLSRTSAYTYLADTVAAFPSREVVLGWMAEAGLRDAVARPLTGGIATLYTARR